MVDYGNSSLSFIFPFFGFSILNIPPVITHTSKSDTMTQAHTIRGLHPPDHTIFLIRAQGSGRIGTRNVSVAQKGTKIERLKDVVLKINFMK